MAAQRLKNKNDDASADSQSAGSSEFDEDTESLRKASMLTGTDLIAPNSAVQDICQPDSDSDGSSEDDCELARRVSDLEFEKAVFKPLSVVPPDDGDENLAVLNAVRSQYSAYHQTSLLESRGMNTFVSKISGIEIDYKMLSRCVPLVHPWRRKIPVICLYIELMLAKGFQIRESFMG